MNIISIISKPELGDIPIMYILRVINAIQSDYIHDSAEGDTAWANRYKEMANDELKHAGYLHDRDVKDIEEISKVFTPTEEMEEKWEKCHKKYVEQTAWIRQMLTL